MHGDNITLSISSNRKMPVECYVRNDYKAYGLGIEMVIKGHPNADPNLASDPLPPWCYFWQDENGRRYDKDPSKK